MNDEQVAMARLFHDTYERLAPSFGYKTRADTKQFDPESANGRLMAAVCGEVIAAYRPLEREVTAIRDYALAIFDGTADCDVGLDELRDAFAEADWSEPFTALRSMKEPSDG